jgi:uncharacterized C2H2 Zn-finger protein
MKRNPDYTCPVCGAVFPSRTQLKSHAYKDHEVYVTAGKAPTGVLYSGPRWKCSKCGEAFYTKAELLKHIEEYETRVRQSSAYGAREYLAEVARRQNAELEYERAQEEARRQRYARESQARQQAAPRPTQNNKTKGYSYEVSSLATLTLILGGLYYAKKREAAKK